MRLNIDVPAVDSLIKSESLLGFGRIRRVFLHAEFESCVKPPPEMNDCLDIINQ